ncbi:zinc-binding dehydrogenase, partial [Acinetobacter baumannii]|uniref:zinc-binding dehydrogenase n=1 Tax=Acinetobacter baumannii TaxID=470 RepID=UPI001D1734F6
APHPSPSVFGLIFKRRRIAGSLIGGIAETQEMLDFCAEHGIVSDIEMIRMQDINEAYERMLNSFDFILNTVAAPHNLDAFVNLLKRDATMTLVGAPAAPHPSPSVFGLIFKRRRIAGSLIGGIAETQEML